ncbi:hypothetical protein EFO52_10715, partial [Lacticaseibacillus rhamnosus]|nr:hypothetical protein [Lacticaseibacillus rhamnosus]
MAKARPSRPRPLILRSLTAPARAHFSITRSPAQKSACKDLSRNGQIRAITSEAAYTPTSNRAGSRSLSLGGFHMGLQFILGDATTDHTQ